MGGQAPQTGKKKSTGFGLTDGYAGNDQMVYEDSSGWNVAQGGGLSMPNAPVSQGPGAMVRAAAAPPAPVANTILSTGQEGRVEDLGPTIGSPESPSGLAGDTSPGAGGGYGIPPYPEYQSMIGPDGILKPTFRSAGGPPVSSRDVSAYALDDSMMNAMKGRALSTGPSAWLGLMNDRIGGMQSGYRDDAVRGARQATTSAMDQAAVRGGLSAGAGARLAGRGLEQSAMGQQAAGKWGADARLQAGLEDERTKVSLLDRLQGHELSKGQYYTGVDERNRDKTLGADLFNSGQTQQNNQFNVGTAKQDVQNQVMRDAAAHGQDISAWVGMQNANPPPKDPAWYDISEKWGINDLFRGR